MLKTAMTSDPLTDISAFRNIKVNFFSGYFHADIIQLFKLAWVLGFIQDDRGVSVQLLLVIR